MQGKEGSRLMGSGDVSEGVQGCYETSQSDKSRVHWDSNQLHPGQELVDGWEDKAGLAWCPAAKSFREGAFCLQGLLSFANLHLTPCPQM